MTSQILFVISLLLFFNTETNCYHHTTDSNPEIRTQLGSFRGSLMKSIGGRTIYAFRGIRYAKPPVNELRFQPPVPVEKFEGTYDATKDGPLCPQPEFRPVAEDCLFLNVYSTKLPTRHDVVKRPVIVFVHHGGFYAVTGRSDFEGPEYFADHDVVLVTINYRLGSLGFLSTGDHLAPGNNGLKDQVVALKWIQANIAAFGGDPNLVTFTGYSAGAFSATLHLVSPMSRGLFHRAIMMSASGYGQWPIPRHQFHLAQKQAEFVGCPNDTSINIINCLKNKSAEELGDTLRRFAEFGGDPILIWSPVIEDDYGQERFLTKNPVESVLEGDFLDIPIITGITRDEFAGPAVELVRNNSLLKEADETFETYAPIAFLYERDTENSRRISKALRKFYLGDGPLSNASETGLAQLYADSVIGFPVNRAVKLLAEKCTEPVYYYRFNYQGRFSYYDKPGTNTPYGIVHHDDLIYLYTSKYFPIFNESFPEYQTMRKLTKLQANFALTGNPTPHRSALLDNVKWDPFTGEEKEYLDIGTKLEMKKNLYEERYQEWEKLFPLP